MLKGCLIHKPGLKHINNNTICFQLILVIQRLLKQKGIEVGFIECVPDGNMHEHSFGNFGKEKSMIIKQETIQKRSHFLVGMKISVMEVVVQGIKFNFLIRQAILSILHS